MSLKPGCIYRNIYNDEYYVYLGKYIGNDNLDRFYIVGDTVERWGTLMSENLVKVQRWQ